MAFSERTDQGRLHAGPAEYRRKALLHELVVKVTGNALMPYIGSRTPMTDNAVMYAELAGHQRGP